METVVYIFITISAIALVAGIFWGKYPKRSDKEIVWRKLDEHEKALGE